MKLQNCGGPPESHTEPTLLFNKLYFNHRFGAAAVIILDTSVQEHILLNFGQEVEALIKCQVVKSVIMIFKFAAYFSCEATDNVNYLPIDANVVSNKTGGNEKVKICLKR